MQLQPSPIVALNRAVAISRVEGALEALAAIAPLEFEPSLANYYLLPALKGRLLMELGDEAAAANCYREALERPCSEPERRFLRRRLEQLAGA